jgi:PilZ domain
MKSNAEKRACERHYCAADIAFSYFNKTHSYHAEILNVGLNGMCFKSNLRLQPGSTVCIRLTKPQRNGSCSGLCEGLRSVTLAEVKWCSELPRANALPYGVGVKYFNPVY